MPVTNEQDRGQPIPPHISRLGEQGSSKVHRTTKRRCHGRGSDICCRALPALLPLAVVHEPMLGLRTANILVAVFLFVGLPWAKLADSNPWIAGFGSMGLGLSLVGLAIALGG